MTLQDSHKTGAVDIVIPVYCEKPEALAATLSACQKQTYPIFKIFVIDDGSPEPISIPAGVESVPQISLIRLHQNGGISAARNAAIACSNANLIACINTEILPNPDWLSTCANYLFEHPCVGACYTRVVPLEPNRILTRWRMRFQEPKYGGRSGPTEFAHGHAVLFRKEAVDTVGGYDVLYRRHHEDWDICRRMKEFGWESHYVAVSACISIQEDSLRSLAIKQLRDSDWFSPTEDSLIRLYVHLSKWTLIRAGRNVVKGRLYLLPVDLAIWASALWIATSLTLRAIGEGDGRPGTPFSDSKSSSARSQGPTDDPSERSREG